MAKEAQVIKKLLLFLVMAIAVVLSLRLLNWLGESINEEGARSFTQVEAARRYLDVEELYLPMYRPQHFQWPPTEILARRSPKQLISHVTERETGEVILAIAQTEAAASDIKLRLEPVNSKRSTEIQLEGRPARLTEAECNTGGTCFQLTWMEGSTGIKMVAKLSREELIRVAESMLPG